MNSSVRVLFITYGGSGTCQTVSLESERYLGSSVCTWFVSLLDFLQFGSISEDSYSG